MKSDGLSPDSPVSGLPSSDQGFVLLGRDTATLLSSEEMEEEIRPTSDRGSESLMRSVTVCV